MSVAFEFGDALHIARHGGCDFVEHGRPLPQMGFALGGQRVDTAGRSVGGDLPSRLDLGEAFQPAKHSVERRPFDLGVGESVVDEVGRQIIAMGVSLFAEDEVKKLLMGECGHASRVAKYFYPAFCGGRSSIPVLNIMEYTHQAWKQGRLKLKADTITETVT